MPTLLDVIGIEAAGRDRRRRAEPRSRASASPPSLDDGGRCRAHTSRSTTRCSARRALYHDGWKAVVFHPLPVARLRRQRPVPSVRRRRVGAVPRAPKTSPRRSTSPRHTRTSWPSSSSCGGRRPSATKCCRSTNQPRPHGDRRSPPRPLRYRRRGVGPLPEAVAPNLRNRPWTIGAEHRLGQRPPVGCDRLRMAAPPGGYAVYVADGRLHYVHNFLGTTCTTVSAEAELPRRIRASSRVVFTPTGVHQGDIELRYDDDVGRRGSRRPYDADHLRHDRASTSGVSAGQRSRLRTSRRSSSRRAR